MDNQRKIPRRDVLKGGVGLGAAGIGLATGTLSAPHVARAADLIEVNILNAGGSFSRVQSVMFRELKLFEKYGVKANITHVSDGSKILAGIISGSGDICGGSGFVGIPPAIAKEAPVKILSAAGIAPLSCIYARDEFADVKSVKDLPGHTVGTGAPGALLHWLAVAVMKKYDVDYKKVNFVNVGSSVSVFKALTGGTVEAGVAPLEFSDDPAQYKIHPLAEGKFYQELPKFVNQGIYASDKAIAEKRRGLVGVMAAYADLFRWIEDQSSKDKFKQYYKEALGDRAKDDTIDWFYGFLGQGGRIATGLVMTKEQIDYVQDLNVELGLQPAVLPFDKVADMSLAEESLKLLQTS